MSEDQPKPINSEQPESQTAKANQSETASVSQEIPPPQKSPTEQKSVVPKPSLWQQVLGLVRSLLPESLGQKLSNGLLTVAIAAIGLILALVFVSFLSGRPATEMADVPVLDRPELPEVIDSELSQMPELASYGAPEVVELTTPPLLTLTPEQFLIDTIRNQIGDLINQYGAGVIESLQADFPTSLLTVELSDKWYDLNPEEQDKLANQMFQQANDLDFSKLQIINSQGRMMARSSVISSDMIILERSLLEIPR
ncbi:MAG: hypothetical protein WBA93_28445 [Microcoleaceae cyanobacterium]